MDSTLLIIIIPVYLIYIVAAINGGNKRTRGKLDSLAANLTENHAREMALQSDHHAKQMDFLKTTCSSMLGSLKGEIQESRNAVLQQNKEMVSQANALVLRTVAEATSGITSNQDKSRDRIIGEVTATKNSVNSSHETAIMGIEQLKKMTIDNTVAINEKADKAREGIIQGIRNAEGSISRAISIGSEVTEQARDQIRADVTAVHKSHDIGFENISRLVVDDTSKLLLNMEKIRAESVEAARSAQDLIGKHVFGAAADVKALIHEHTIALSTNLDQSRALILRRTDSADYLSAVENAGFLADKVEKTQAVIVEAVWSAQGSTGERISGESQEIKMEVVAQLSAVSDKAREQISGELTEIHATILDSSTRIDTSLELLKKMIGEDTSSLSSKMDTSRDATTEVVRKAEEATKTDILAASENVRAKVIAQLSMISDRAGERISGGLAEVHDTVRGAANHTDARLEHIAKKIGDDTSSLTTRISTSQETILEALWNTQRSLGDGILGAAENVKTEAATQLSSAGDELCHRISSELNRVQDAVHGAAASVDAELDYVKKIIVSDGTQLSTRIDQSQAAIVQALRSAQDSVGSGISGASENVKSTLLAQLATLGENIDRSREKIVGRTDSMDYLASLDNTKEVLKSVSQVRSEMNTVAELIKITMINNLVSDMHQIIHKS